MTCRATPAPLLRPLIERSGLPPQLHVRLRVRARARARRVPHRERRPALGHALERRQGPGPRPPAGAHTETAPGPARRGARRTKHSRDRGLSVRIALLEGQALNDLGRPREAIGRLDAAVAASPEDLRVRYERGVTLFELCRF